MFIKNVQSSQSRTWLNGKAFLIIMLVFFSMTVGAENVEGLTVTSSSFTNNANIPLANAGNAWGQCFGSNISPQLSLCSKTRDVVQNYQNLSLHSLSNGNRQAS